MPIAHAPALLARLRTCQALGRPVPPELLAQLIDGLSRDVRVRSQLQQRNTLIRRAGLLLPVTGPSAKAEALLAESKRLRPALLVTAKGESPATVRECLAVAATYGRLPSSQRQFLRVLLQATDK